MFIGHILGFCATPSLLWAARRFWLCLAHLSHRLWLSPSHSSLCYFLWTGLAVKSESEKNTICQTGGESMINKDCFTYLNVEIEYFLQNMLMLILWRCSKQRLVFKILRSFWHNHKIKVKHNEQNSWDSTSGKKNQMLRMEQECTLLLVKEIQNSLY